MIHPRRRARPSLAAPGRSTPALLPASLIILALISGVGAQEDNSNEQRVGIILGAIGGSILVILILLLCCILCRSYPPPPPHYEGLQGRPSKNKKGSLPTEYRNGTIPNHAPRTTEKTPVPPGVWTSNPTMFVGVPNKAYHYGNGEVANKKPPHAYSNGVAGRHYTSNPDVRLQYEQPKKPAPVSQAVIQSQPDLRSAARERKERASYTQEVSTLDEEPQTPLNVKDLAGRFESADGGVVRAFSNYNQRESGSPKRKSAGYDPYVAKVFSDYPDPKRKSSSNNISVGSTDNVARAFNTYGNTPGKGRDPDDSRYVARAVVRSHDTALNELDRNGQKTHAVFVPSQSDWSLHTGRPGKPVQRTQSHLDRRPPSSSSSNGNRRSVFEGGSKKSSGSGGDVPIHGSRFSDSSLGYRVPQYNRGVYLNRSPSDVGPHAPKRDGSVDRKQEKKKFGFWNKSQPQHAAVGRTRSADNYPGYQATTLPPPQPVQLGMAPQGNPVQRSVSDASAIRPMSQTDPLPPIPASPVPSPGVSEGILPSPGAEETVVSIDLADETDGPGDDPHALYARPSKIKRNPADRPRQMVPPEEPSSPAPPPVPPHQPHLEVSPPSSPSKEEDKPSSSNKNNKPSPENTITVQAVVENQDNKVVENREPENPYDLIGGRGRSKSTSSDRESIGKVTSDAFKFLDEFEDDFNF